VMAGIEVLNQDVGVVLKNGLPSRSPRILCRSASYTFIVSNHTWFRHQSNRKS